MINLMQRTRHAVVAVAYVVGGGLLGAALALAVTTLAFAYTDSNTDSDPDVVTTGTTPACIDVFAPGRPTDEVMADYAAGPCLDSNGSVYVTYAVASKRCADGTTRYYIEGYGSGTTDQPWQPPTGTGAIDATACP